MPNYSIVVRNGDRILQFIRNFVAGNTKSIWEKVHELSCAHHIPGTRVTVYNEGGETVISVGVVTAHMMHNRKAA